MSGQHIVDDKLKKRDIELTWEWQSPNNFIFNWMIILVTCK